MLYFRRIISKKGRKQIDNCHSIKEAGEFYLIIYIIYVYIKKDDFIYCQYFIRFLSD